MARTDTCGPGVPDLSAFPRTGWLSAARKALSGAPSQALGYSDPRGLPELRTALAAYLARARGVRADPERLIVCSGFAQGLALLCQVLPGSGVGRIAVEEYGRPGPVQALAASGLAPVMLSVDDDGAVLGQAPDAEAMLLTPAHQFPLGSVLSPQRRADAARWAVDGGGLIIEDDYDGEFRYDRQPVGALQALAPEHVIYAGTVGREDPRPRTAAGLAGTPRPPSRRRGRRQSPGRRAHKPLRAAHARGVHHLRRL